MTEPRMGHGSLGGYRLVQRLGRDATGTVYRARDASGGEVAVKVIDPGLTADSRFMAGLRSGGSEDLCAAIGVSGVLDSDLDGRRPYVVSDLASVPAEFPAPSPPQAPPGREALSAERPPRRPWPPPARIAVAVAAVLLVVAAVSGVMIWLDDGVPEPVELVYRGTDGETLVTDPSSPVRRVPIPVDGPMPQATMISVIISSAGGAAGGEAGVVCHGNGPDGYELTFRGTGKATIAKAAGGRRSTLASAPVSPAAAAAREGVPGTSLVAACVRERTTPLVRLSLWLDGERVVDAVDGRRPLKSGSAGLVARQYAGSRATSRANFKDLQVSRF